MAIPEIRRRKKLLEELRKWESGEYNNEGPEYPVDEIRSFIEDVSESRSKFATKARELLDRI